MLHEVLVAYLEKVEQAILQCRNVYVERYIEEIRHARTNEFTG